MRYINSEENLKENYLKNYAIILASGTGDRFGSKIPKQFVEISNRTILERTIDIFEQSERIDEIIVVITPDYKELAQNIIVKNKYKKISKLPKGGAIRKESSYNGVFAINDEEANVLIHDCARPFVSQEIINNCVEALKFHNAVLTAIPSTDTIVKIKNDMVSSIPLRSELMCAQTPQCFKLSLIKKAHELSKNDNDFTDDCGLIVKYNLASVFIVKGSSENIKITYNTDIYTANAILKQRNTSN